MDAQVSGYHFSACEEPPRKRRRLDATVDSAYSRYEIEQIFSLECIQTEVAGVKYDVELERIGHGDLDVAAGNLQPDQSFSCATETDSPCCPHPDDLVCFGMFANLPVRLHPNHDLPTDQSSVLCFVDRDGNAFNAFKQNKLGTIDKHTAEAICVLSDEPGIMAQSALLFCREVVQTGRHAAPPVLNVIVYGPLNLFEDVGDFAQDCSLYLQDPVGCACNVPYVNPHRLSRSGAPPMTFDLPQHDRDGYNGVGNASEFFNTLESSEALDVVKTPDALSTQLHIHQQRALAFMRRREQGWALCGPHQDVWAKNRDTFVSCVTGDRQHSPPKAFKGGLLADEMGLGKTLSMIALVASDKDPELQDRDDLTGRVPPENYADCTLIIVPSPLLQVWTFQLGHHLRPGRISWTKHHSTTRLTGLCDLRKHDIVLTSYQTIAAERTQNKYKTSPLFTTHWKRIILDEAHFIRERKTITAKAVFSLNADRRWAMTGTPVQNSLNDFASLLEYLRVHPFEEPGAFDRYIHKPWKEQNAQEAIDRLKRLVQCIVLRRSKKAIQLPDRYDHIRCVDFTPEEHSYYKEVSCPVEKMLDTLVQRNVSQRGQFLSVIQRINVLRMICNLGVFCKSLGQRQSSPLPQVATWSSAIAQGLFETLLGIGEASCTNCFTQVDNAVEASGFLSVPPHSLPRMFRCQKLICAACFSQSGSPRSPGTQPPGCGCIPSCPSEIVQLNTTIGFPTPPPASPESPLMVSSKVLELVKDIQCHLDEKSVVFSFWTRSLDMIERALDHVGIRCVRFDGRVTPRDREVALKRLRDDPNTRVMLITTSCGAVGLDLTAASRAYLLEPQWNPTTEDQALARVHRMGQKRPVTTIRFIVRGSFEEHVMKVQDRKRQLADLFFSGSKAGDANTTQEKYQQLRSLVSGQ